jgi:hypothetical protein
MISPLPLSLAATIPKPPERLPVILSEEEVHQIDLAVWSSKYLHGKEANRRYDQRSFRS